MRALLFFMLLPIFSFGQLTQEQEAVIDSLKKIIESTELDTIKVNAWAAWNDIIQADDVGLSFELNNQITDLSNNYLDNIELPLPEEEKTFYKRSLIYANNNIGTLHFGNGQYEEAYKVFDKNMQLYEDLGDEPGLAELYYNLAMINYTTGDYVRSEEATKIALKMYQDLKDTLGIANTLNTLGALYFQQGEMSKSIDYFTENASIFKEAEQYSELATTNNNIASIYYKQGKYEKAIEVFVDNIDAFTELEDKSGLALTYNNIGVNYSSLGDLSQAIDYCMQSLKIYEEIEDKSGVAKSLNDIGDIYDQYDNVTQAKINYEKALNISEELGEKEGIAYALCKLGAVVQNEANYEEAINYFEQALKIRKNAENKFGEADVYLYLGSVEKDRKKYNEALEFYNNALSLFDGSGYNRGIANALLNIGETNYYLGRYSSAIKDLKKALSIAESINNLNIIRSTSEFLYRSYKAIGNRSQALDYHEKYISAKDSIQSEKNQREVLKQEYKYAYEKKTVADSLEYAKEQVVVEVKLEKEEQKSNFLFVGMGAALLFGGFIFNRFRLTNKQKKIIEEQKLIVEEEKEKSDKLLLNILPKDTAEELKNKGSVRAQYYPDATVLFTDFKGFSSISEKLAPEKLVRELDDCFSAFDQIMEKYGVEKIKTIGDAYMAVGGIPINTETHYEDVLKAAFEIREYMQQLADNKQKTGEPYFEIRIGIHTGPLVAGVVGTKKFQYDVWGDTVNVASRMESNSEPGKVNISESVYQLIKSEKKYTFSPRGEIDVKGKGHMKMYFVDIN